MTHEFIRRDDDRRYQNFDQEAVEVMKKILKLDPDNALVKENLAMLEGDA